MAEDFSRKKKPSKARTAVGRGKASLLCDPGYELQIVGGREKRKAKTVNGIKNIEYVNKYEEGISLLLECA